jgi:colanic acid biosynthesis glycosyl transferase WcaI
VRGVRTAAREAREGVEILRAPSTAFDRSSLLRRALNYATYLAGSLLIAVRGPRPDVVMCWTDPPVIGVVALLAARRFRAPLVVVSQDVFPETAIELRRITNPRVVGVLRAAINFYLRRADRVVAIGETMRQRLLAKGARHVDVIPNWVDTSQLTPQPRDNQWRDRHGLGDAFVVMHSGNVGQAQDLDTLVRASTLVDGVRVVIVGEGSRKGELVALARKLEAPVTFLPLQRREELSLSLSAADVHVVGLARGLAGYVVPSRLYGVLAVGRPVIAAAEAESETAQLVAGVGCGVVVPPGDPEALAAALRDPPTPELGERGREWVVANADREVAVARYRGLLHASLR